MPDRAADHSRVPPRRLLGRPPSSGRFTFLSANRPGEPRGETPLSLGGVRPSPRWRSGRSGRVLGGGNGRGPRSRRQGLPEALHSAGARLELHRPYHSGPPPFLSLTSHRHGPLPPPGASLGSSAGEAVHHRGGVWTAGRGGR